MIIPRPGRRVQVLCCAPIKQEADVAALLWDLILHRSLACWRCCFAVLMKAVLAY
jgi:hypothetical protein